MKCPECVKEGRKSTVYPGSGMTTAMACSPYYDEEGVYHFHDRNYTTQNYSCSNGHRWDERSRSKCINCDWPNGDEE
jgi:hypothetical protein